MRREMGRETSQQACRAARVPDGFFSSANSLTPQSSKNGASGGSGPLFSYAVVSSRVLILAGLDIGLIERIDAEDCARHRRGDLPAEEFLADVIAVGDADAHDRVAGASISVDGLVLMRIRPVARRM